MQRSTDCRLAGRPAVRSLVVPRPTHQMPTERPRASVRQILVKHAVDWPCLYVQPVARSSISLGRCHSAAVQSFSQLGLLMEVIRRRRVFGFEFECVSACP